MTELVPAADIEAIIGVERHVNLHIGRRVDVDGTVYVMHPQKCIESGIDLRDCRFSRALDNGVFVGPPGEDADEDAFAAGAACSLYIGGPHPVKEPMLRVGDQWHSEPAHVRALADATHRIESGRAVCDGDATARCHWWPDPAVCDHEAHPCGHDYVDHGECWIIQWISAGDLEDSAMKTAVDRYAQSVNADGELFWPDGQITHTWDDDYVLWDYTVLDGLIPLADTIVDQITKEHTR